jgi:hypothetical protein
MNPEIPMQSALHPVNLQNGAHGHWPCNTPTQAAARHDMAAPHPRLAPAK